MTELDLKALRLGLELERSRAARLRARRWRIKGTRQIRVILYAKGGPFCGTAPADELPVEDILAIEHDVIPLDVGAGTC